MGAGAGAAAGATAGLLLPPLPLPLSALAGFGGKGDAGGGFGLLLPLLGGADFGATVAGAEGVVAPLPPPALLSAEDAGSCGYVGMIDQLVSIHKRPRRFTI